MGKCVFCKNIASIKKINPISVFYLFSCESCGEYKVSSITIESLPERRITEEEIEAMREFLGEANGRDEAPFLTNNNNNEDDGEEEKINIDFIFQEHKIKKQINSLK